MRACDNCLNPDIEEVEIAGVQRDFCDTCLKLVAELDWTGLVARNVQRDISTQIQQRIDWVNQTVLPMAKKFMFDSVLRVYAKADHTVEDQKEEDEQARS